MINKLKQMIKQGIVSLLSEDTADYPSGQCFYNGKTSNYVRLSPYGLESNPPVDTWMLLFNSQGQESVKFGLHSAMTERKKNLAEGEVALFNPDSGSYVHLKKGGAIDIEAKGDLTANVTGDANVTATGDVTATGVNVNATGSTKITLTAPDIALIGNIELGGNVTGSGGGAVTSTGTIQAGTIIGTTEVTAGGKNLKAHTHPINSGSSSPGPTGVNN